IASARLQDVFLEVLDLRRLKSDGVIAPLPADIIEALGTFEAALAARLDLMGSSVDANPGAADPAVEQSARALQQLLARPSGTASPPPPWVPTALALSSTRLVSALRLLEQALADRSVVVGTGSNPGALSLAGS